MTPRPVVPDTSNLVDDLLNKADEVGKNFASEDPRSLDDDICRPRGAASITDESPDSPVSHKISSSNTFIILGDLVLPRPPPDLKLLAEKLELDLRKLDRRDMTGYDGYSIPSFLPSPLWFFGHIFTESTSTQSCYLTPSTHFSAP